jgi:pyridoxine 4-dehydrogenase
MTERTAVTAGAARTVDVCGDSTVKPGLGAMPIPGPGIWGQPTDRAQAVAVLGRAIELEGNFIGASPGRARPGTMPGRGAAR